MGKRKEDNVTWRHIEQKKREIARLRRRRFLRRLLAMVIFTVLLLLAAGGIYALVRGTEYLVQEYQMMYAGYTERRASWQGAVNPSFDGYTNVLVMGIDDGADPTNTEGAKADTILVLSMENSSGKVRCITIPSDTWVNPPGNAHFMRICSVYTEGGAPLMVREVNQLLGIPIHQYVVLDLKGFSALIDALGGIDIYVESDMDYEDPEGGSTSISSRATSISTAIRPSSICATAARSSAMLDVSSASSASSSRSTSRSCASRRCRSCRSSPRRCAST